MRDLMLLGVMAVLFPLAISNSFLAYLLWGWAGLIALNSYLYGFMAGVPFVQIFAMIALVLILIKRDGEQIAFTANRTIFLFVVLACHSALVAAFAYEGLPRNAETISNILKTLLYCSLMPMLVTSRLRIHALVVAIVLALSFHGLLDGLKFLASGGTHNARGVAKFGDNNYLAMALVTVIPLQLYLYRYSKNRLAKLGFAGVALLTILAVVATHSRGGFLTLFCVAIWLLWGSKRKALGLASLFACAVLVVVMAPASWSERMGTMQRAGEDSSFMTRVAVWKKSTAIALAHPVVGGGFFAVQSPPTFEKFRNEQGLLGFIDTPDPAMYAAHSIYFQVMSDMGFVGFFVYFVVLANAFITRFEIRNLAGRLGPTAGWAVDLSNMLAAGLIAFMVGGALLSAAYLEIPFLMVALLEVVKQQLLRQLSSGAEQNNISVPSQA
ncbi:putative O-glycosylation ligase, exosortase A system-associated [bacterium]|nr:putative O-glycosylation ligase, exosortase A system-associated [bacterium]